MRALGAAQPSPDVLAVDLVNTAFEVFDLTSETGRLAEHVARASLDAERAPLVRISNGDDYALLTSPQHLWRLVDRVDELELAIGVLAGACVRGLTDPRRMERLLQQLDA